MEYCLTYLITQFIFTLENVNSNDFRAIARVFRPVGLGFYLEGFATPASRGGQKCGTPF